MVIILMGVSGSGKTTVGQLLASRLHLHFKDADTFHPKCNIEKMRSGIPLNDEDRQPWLETLSDSIKEWNQKSNIVLACSALKKSYRETLRKNFRHGDIVFIFLNGAKKLISERLKLREGHYMPSELLDSQFETLERPNQAISVSIKPTPDEIVDEILSKLSITLQSDHL